MSDLPPAIKFAGPNRQRVAERRERQKAFMLELQNDPTRTLAEVGRVVGVTERTIRRWREIDRQFDMLVTTQRAQGGWKEAQRGEDLPETDTFIGFRKRFFGFDTPWFQADICDRFETAEPGSITLCLLPPEHGKTTLTEDHLTYEISEDPSTLITLVSEGERMAKKMSRRIQRRLEIDGSSQDLVYNKGPFRSPEGARASQPWSVEAWTVMKGLAEDSRDFTVAVGGWKSNIAGTRATRLHIDDLQSLKSLNSTQDMFDIFRQDMLSRPGETGRTTINGTRVGELDFYNAVIEEFSGEDFFKLIMYPALVLNQMTGEVEPLWKEKNSMEQMERMRKKVGEDAWWRNYMQNPRTSTMAFFTEDGIDKSKNRMRTIGLNRDQLGFSNDEVWLTLDPAIGGRNVVMAMHFEPDRLVVLDVDEKTDLARNSAIAARVEDMIQRMLNLGLRPVTLVIEAMAFQKGLMEDESFTALRDRYGIRLESHETGINKYDEDIGMASLASSVEAGNIDLPYGDEASEYSTDVLVAQFRAWKPTRDRATGKLKFQRGNRLRQDQLMALWFGWIWWTSLRTNAPVEDLSKAFRRGGLPFTPTSSGLLVPR